MYYNINNINETKTLKSVSGQLIRVIVNTPGTIGSELTLHDGSTVDAPLICRINTAIMHSSLLYDLECTSGLTYVTSGGPGNITIVYT